MWTDRANSELPTPKLGSAGDIKRIAVIFNGGKDRKKVDKYVKLIQKRAPTVEIDVIMTQNFADGVTQAKQAQEKGYDLLVAAGGDGTLLSVVNGLVHTETVFSQKIGENTTRTGPRGHSETECPLGQVSPPIIEQVPQTLLSILPLGSANDYARAAGINGLEEAVEAVCTGVVRQADVGRCTYQDFDQQTQQDYFCSTAGVGFFAHVARVEEYAISAWLKKVLKDAVWPLLAAAALFSTQQVSSWLRINEHKIELKMRMLEVSNVQRAGGILLTPLASLNNEILDSWLDHNLTVRDVWRVFFTGLANKGAHFDHPNLEYFTSEPKWNRYGYSNPTRVEVHPAQPQPVNQNGEFVGQTPALFEVLPNALRVLAPK